MIRNKRLLRKNAHGFTIVELLIVIVVIGILAAITMVAYGGIQAKAHDSAIQSDVKNLATKVRSYQAETGTLPTTYSHFSGLGVKVSKNSYDHYYNGAGDFNLVYCYRPSAAPTEFAIIAYGKGKNYKYDGGGNLSEFTIGKTGSVTACNNAGVPLENAADRFWFYDNNNWQPFL